MARVVTNAKCREMLRDLLPIAEERFLTIEDHGTLSLGDRTLEFILAPWVHWPETMFTWLREDGVLFSCDFLGSHYATSELFSTDGAEILASAKRYYAEIMMPFRPMIRKHLERLAPYPIKMICPSHGPVYRNPDFILDAYRDWVSDAVKSEVIVGFVSMHGSTRLMAERFIDELIKREIKVKPYNLVTADIGHIAMDLVDAATMVVATPVVLTGVHPLAITPIYLTNLLRPKLRHLGLISSYGWGGKVAEKVQELITAIKPEILTPVLVKGLPRAVDFAALAALAETIAERHRSL
jgi:flavorubredoxin